MFNLENFLLMREKRVEIQNSIINEYKNPILVLRINYPGENKNNFVVNSIFNIMKTEIFEIFNSKIIFSKKIDSIEGPSLIFSINESDLTIKKIMIDLEETHILGRCVDLDVFSSTGYALSRKDFNLEKRQCLICNNMAFICGRSQAHSLNDLIKTIENKLEYYLHTIEPLKEKISNQYSNLSLKAIILEVSSSPSFGLVSPHTNGAHKDMNFFTFIESSFAINSYLKEVSKAGFSSLPLNLIFRKIRYMGTLAEKEMFNSTDNINTHKGMIFLMGISVACASYVKYNNLSFKDISITIKKMCEHILIDFENINTKNNLTHGESLYLKYGITGIRGIVKNGLDIVFNGSLPIFIESFNLTKDINSAMLKTLIYLMANLEDTTILHRHDYEVLKYVQQFSLDLHNQFENSNLNIDLLKNIEKDFIIKNISPGGAADLLAITIFFYYINNLN